MAELLPGLVLLLFLTWLVITVLFQFDRLAVKIAPLDLIKVVPRWTFFAPNPGHHDMHLLVRDRLVDRTTGWAEVVLIGATRSVPLLWNPEKRLDKVLWDAWEALRHLAHVQKIPMLDLQLSAPYFILLNAALRHPVGPGAEGRQFALVRSAGFTERPVDVLFVSVFHSLGDRAGRVGLV